MRGARRGPLLAAGLGAWLALASPAGAEIEWGPILVSGDAEFGGRGVFGDTGSAKFEQYRDVRSNPFGGLDLLVEDLEHRYYLQAWLDDIGERDQQYRLQAGRYGRWRLHGFYSEMPRVFSNQAVTPTFDAGRFTCAGGPTCDGVTGVSGDYLALVPAFDRTLAAGSPGYAAQVAALSARTPLEYELTEGEAGIAFRPTSAWDVSADYHILERKGNRPQALGFGFGNYVNAPAPIDERTHEARVDVQYVGEDWNLGLGYLGSFFENDLDFYQVDNPLVAAAAETFTEAALGRVGLAPDNSAHLVSLSGAAIVPASFPARVAGSFAWGMHLQDDDFLPVTSNAVINATMDPLLTLARGSLDGKVQTINGNLVFTARPAPDLNVKARYRIYDYDNQTDEGVLSGEAPFDTNDVDENVRPGVANIAYRYTRHQAMAEASWRPSQAAITSTVGFEWELWDRDRAREVDHYNSFGPTARVDWRAADWARVRVSYAFLAGMGDGYDPLAGALAGLRKYSQADRFQHDLTLLAQFDPCEDVGITLTSGFRLTDYNDSAQGLVDDNRWNIGIDTSYQIHERVGLFAGYDFDSIHAFQRQGGGSWDSDTRDRAHNFNAGANVAIVPGRLDGTASYFLQTAHADTTGGGTAADFPRIKDRLQAAVLQLDGHVFEYLTLRATYRWEKYDRENFHEAYPIPTNGNGDLYLQNRIADYNAHILGVSAIVHF